MDKQLDIINAAKARGWDAANLSPAQYRALAIDVRSTSELARDSVRALASKAKNLVGVGQVSPAKVAENSAVCQSNRCERFRLLNTQQRTFDAEGRPVVKITSQRPACDACNCSNKFLEAKWADNTQECPIVDPTTNKKYWSNLGA